MQRVSSSLFGSVPSSNKKNWSTEIRLDSIRQEQSRHPVAKSDNLLSEKTKRVMSMLMDSPPLDLAVMTTNVAMVQLLQSHGGAESPKFSCRESRSNQLQVLVREAGRCVEDLETCVLSAATNGSLSAALLKFRKALQEEEYFFIRGAKQNWPQTREGLTANLSKRCVVYYDRR
ncbi:ankyrin repeat and fibronectin type-III domain-containing protein 1 [Caerostris extrusa]|uniref:Ankyrin repeat and fibronectin type-III domain-containing protein 1 n=1 Tax=Caerostris extrusa TaxID=172846 RepID=A0AAV4NYD3_CAEEX|nr:ankyrin repeat and fibronectin type-III domain-containing protein 1 [Caerostris extrusa]